jgi:hypothetical protein
MDFELAAMRAVQDVFPNSQIFFCLFHLTQNLKKHLREAELINAYNTDADFAIAARMIISLAFVPLTSLDNAFAALENHITTNVPELLPIIAWFETNYLGDFFTYLI